MENEKNHMRRAKVVLVLIVLFFIGWYGLAGPEWRHSHYHSGTIQEIISRPAATPLTAEEVVR